MKATKERFKQKTKAREKGSSKYTLFSRISVRFVAFVVLATLLTGGIISFAAITISKNTIHQEIFNNSHTQAELTAEFTANYIEVIQANIKSFSTISVIIDYLNEKNIQAATEMLVQFVQIQKVLDASGLYDANGIQLAVSTPNATTNGQSFADREWFQQAKSTKLPFFSAPIKSRSTGNAIAPYAIPILNEENQLIGVISGTISLVKLSAVIVKINTNSDISYALIDLRNGGTIIAHGDPQMILTSVSESYTSVINLMSSGESGGLEVTNSDGEKDLIGFAVLSNLPWGVMIVTPSETAFASISALTQTAGIISIVIVLITAVLGALFVLQITKPIQRLVEETKEIGKGNLDYQIKTTRKGEIGDLSRAFSDMTGNLKKVMVSNERLIEEADGRKSAEKRLEDLNETLEQKVKERTSQLEISNQELESFSYSVSHDLRAPLRHVTGFVELLNDHLKENVDGQSRHYLNVISNAANDMGQLIDDLLSFSRMGKSKIEKSKIDLNTIVKDVAADFQPEIKGRNVNWNISELPVISGDINMIRLVFSNLISNALKFTHLKESAKIEIGSEPDTENSDYVIIYTRDNGAGFDMQYKEKLFGVFQRLHSQKDFKGTGIGLANVKRIIQRHGGRVWADGVPGEGAVFYFTLPKYKEESI